MLFSRTIILATALIFVTMRSGFAGQEFRGAEKQTCPSIDEKTIERINKDQKLSALHVSDMPCDSLERLVQIIKDSAPTATKKHLLPTPQIPDPHSRATQLAANAAADATPKPETADYAQQNAQRFFIRQSSLDAFYYLYPSSTNQASGASISYTNDEIAKTQAISVQGYTAYVVARDLAIFVPESYTGPYLSKWAIAPFLSASGSLNEPVSPKEKSALQLGGEVQFEISH
jgi:hypothetical protein